MRLDSLAQDLRSAVRNLRRSPGFAVLTILTLSVGIGANTAMFSVLNAVILRPAAYPRPDQLMFVSSRFPSLGFNQFWVSPPEYFELTEINQSFSSVGAYRDGRGQRVRRRSSSARQHWHRQRRAARDACRAAASRTMVST